MLIDKYSDGAIDPIKDMLEQIDKELEEIVESEEAQDVNKPSKIRLFEKFDFTWTNEQKAYLTIIKAAAENLVADILAEPIVFLDSLYAQARVIAVDSNGRRVKDAQGRNVWATDENNIPIEDWSSVTTSDLENAWLKLTRSKYKTSEAVSELFLEAVLAKMEYKNVFYDKYSRVIEGTVNEKTAAAEKAHRKEKYRAFSRYWLWYTADQISKEINSVTRAVEKLREWRNWGPKS